MIHSIVHFMVSNQVFTLFICLAIGFLIGNYKIAGKFNIGATVGTLIVTLIVGQVGSFPRDEMLERFSLAPSCSLLVIGSGLSY